MDNIYEKIAKIRKMVEALQKNADGYGYKYVSEDEILARVTAGLEKYKVDVLPAIKPGTMAVTPYQAVKNKVLKDGTIYEDKTNEIIVQAEITFEWINLEDLTDRLSVPWVIVGQQSDAAQALGSALTYGTRYFFLKFFKSSTLESDPDQWRTKQQDAMNFESKEVVSAIVGQINEICSANTTEANKPELIKLVKSIVKKNGKASADYTAIDDPETASRLLTEVKKFFGIDSKKDSK